MKTTFDILDLLYPLIGVPNITGIIDGKVYREKKPLNSKKQDIVINTLSNNNNEGIVQQSIVNINIFCKNHDNGIPNETKLKEITTAVKTELDVYTRTPGVYFHFNVVWQTTMQDNDDIEMSFVNIRLNCVIEK